MSVVLRYLKASILPIILVVVLLFAKASADLVLPMFTARIVNIGIQQGGVEQAIPVALTEQTFATLLKRADADQVALLEQSYRLDQTTYLMPAFTLVPNAPVREPDMIPLLTGNLNEEESPGTIERQSALLLMKQESESLGIDVQATQHTYILRTGTFMLLLSALGMIASILVSFLASRVAARLGRDLRSALFSKTLTWGQEEMDRFSTASLVTRSTNDIQQIQQSFVMILRVVIFAPLMAVGGLLRVIQTNNSMTWIIALAILAIVTVVLAMFTLAMPRFKRLQLLIDTINRIVRETLNGLQVIRAFNTQEHEKARFARANEDLTVTTRFVNRAMSAMMPMMMLIMNLTAILIVHRGAAHIASGTMQVGDMMAFIQYSMLIIMSFLMITMLTIVIPRAAISAARIKEVLDTPATITSSPGASPVSGRSEGRIVFDHVSFVFPGAEAEALDDISFVAENGSITAIIGSTGSGKSTLLNLMLRFHDVSSGSISIDGCDIRQANLGDLRSMIGMVGQQGFLFSGTIASNIAFGEVDISHEKVEQAAWIADADSFIKERPEGYESPVTQGGGNVSGGQRQRIAIARAVARSPRILLFDDSFSALDYQSELRIRSRLRSHLSHITTIIVAQRISSIMHADTILVLEEGRLVDQGNHHELLDRCPVYQQIARSQYVTEREQDHA